jgi:hypothetical protein
MNKLFTLCAGIIILNFQLLYAAPAPGALQSSVTFVNTTCGTCNGAAAVTVFNGVPPYRFLWQPGGDTTNAVSNLCAGTYIVNITDSVGNTAADTLVIAPSVAPAVFITATSSIICAGDSSNICATTGFVSYLWNNSDTTQCIYDHISGNFEVTVTDTNFCTAVSNPLTITVDTPVAPIITISGDTLSASGSVAYQWYLNGTAIANANSATYIADIVGSYTVYGTDSLGCGVFSNAANETVTVYHAMLSNVNVWSYVGTGVAVSPQGTNNETKSLNTCQLPFGVYGGYADEYTGDDTIIDTLNYKILWMHYYTPLCTEGFIREDSIQKKVYFKSILDSSEIVLYDFSMAVGDSLSLYFGQGCCNYFQSGFYGLDSIKNVTINGGNRRKFYLNCHSCSQSNNTLSWIESVGSQGGPLYPFYYNINGGGDFRSCGSGSFNNNFPYDFIQTLTCFSHETKIYFDSCVYQTAVRDQPCYSIQDSCHFDGCGGINDIPSLASLSFYPNPASTQITLNFNVNRSDNFDVAILDMQGRQTLPTNHLGLLREGEQTRTLDIAGLANGIYLIACKTGAGSLYRKLVVQR